MNDIVSRAQLFSFFFPPLRSQNANRSFQIELKTLDIRSNSAHEDEWAANCGLSRMSRAAALSPCHFPPPFLLCTLHCKSISLSTAIPSLSLPSVPPLRVCIPVHHPPWPAQLSFPLTTARLCIGALASTDGVTNARTRARARGHIHHASHFVTAGSTALKLYSRFENSP